MTNYQETSAYDLSLFEPQVVEPRRVRETQQPVKRQAVKKQTKKPVKKTQTKTRVNAPAKKQSVNYSKPKTNTVKRLTTVNAKRTARQHIAFLRPKETAAF